jgi:ankyrin repeat protein
MVRNGVREALAALVGQPGPDVTDDLIAGAFLAMSKGEEFPALHMAVHADCPEVIAALIDSGGVDVEVKFEGKTALHYALGEPGIKRRKACVDALIAAGADVDAAMDGEEGNSELNSWKGTSPIVVALRRRSRPLALCATLIAAGCDVNRIDGGLVGEPTPLHEAAHFGQVECIVALVEASADVNARTTIDWTPLHVAAHFGHVEIVQKLLSFGADCTIPDKDGQTPLSIAAMTERHGKKSLRFRHERHTGTVLALLAAEKEAGRVSLNVPDHEGFTPLHYAADSGNCGAVEALIAAGSDLSLQTTGKSNYRFGGLTPLHCAIGGDDDDDDDDDETRAKCVAALLKAGAPLDLRDHSFSTPLQFAAVNGMSECAEVLIAAEKRGFLSTLLADRLPLPKDLQLVVVDFVLSLAGELGEVTDSESDDSDEEASEEEESDDDANDDDEERTVESDGTGDY